MPNQPQVATAAENRVVNAAGLVQGITLVTFPAASSILTAKDGYDLSSGQYGDMFLPQVAAAIVASLSASRLSRRLTAKRVLLLGLASNLVSMGLLLSSTAVEDNQAIAYPILLMATAFLGIGFGLTVPTLNTLTAAFHPAAVDRNVLVLNSLLGLGTVLAPLFVAFFVGLGFWWGLPLTSATLIFILMLAAARQPLVVASPPSTRTVESAHGTRPSLIPARFWLFASFAMLYGICETMNGNWAQVYMTGHLGSSALQASLALTAFWAMVTIGRVTFARVARWLPTRVTFHVLPVVLVFTFTATALLPAGDAAQGIVVFALAGLGCSALLPLSISFGQESLATMSSAVTGGVIAFYQIGYGIAAFGVGPLLASGRDLSGIYGLTAIVAAALALVSFAVAHRRPSPPRLHPHPTPPIAATAH